MNRIWLILILSDFLYAAAALPGDHTFTQANGQSFSGKLQGDEWLHWIRLKNDFIAVFNPQNKSYEYARVIQEEDGAQRLEPSGILVDPSLHLANPSELAKKTPPVPAELLGKIHRSTYNRLHSFAPKKATTEKGKVNTKSKVWEEILKEEKTAPQDGEN